MHRLAQASLAGCLFSVLVAVAGCSAASSAEPASAEAEYTGARPEGEFFDPTGTAPVAELILGPETANRRTRDGGTYEFFEIGYGVREAKSFLRLYAYDNADGHGPLVESYEWKLEGERLSLRATSGDTWFSLEKRSFYVEGESCGDGNYECAEGLVCARFAGDHPACPPDRECAVCVRPAD